MNCMGHHALYFFCQFSIAHNTYYIIKINITYETNNQTRHRAAARNH
jgi:hypothetical protein